MIKRKKPTGAPSLAKYSLLLVPFALGALVYLYTLTLPPAKQGELQLFVVNPGETVTQIANRLHQEGFIRSPLYFRYLVARQNLVPQAGDFYFSPTAPPSQIALYLTEGRASEIRLTIPEGYRLEEIAALASQRLGLDPGEFLKASKGLEGRLFPDTYFLSPDTSAEALVQLMQDNFSRKVGQLEQETLILASLVERETKGSQEKPLVAGILQKRLEAGWPLELDATVQYVLGDSNEWWPVTTLKDREVASPYNTYGRLGLPKGPICNPGLESINAAQAPQTSDYWFYLHDRDGTIRYAKTLQEHNANISRYLYQ